MKLGIMQFKLLLILSVAVYIASAVPVQQNEEPSLFDYSEDEEGDVNIDLEEEVDEELLEEINNNPTNNIHLLFTRNNPEEPQQLFHDDEESVRSSNFDANKPLAVIIHGWLSSQSSGINAAIKDALLEKDDVNVLVLDWRRLAVAGYVTAVRGVPSVGRGLGMFLAFLNKSTGIPYSKIHLIGFSLGSHVAGNAGKELEGQVARISALDPAGPLWILNSNKISSSDAIYVEGVHTNGGLTGLGYGSAIGDVDFFVNGGNSQGGCITPVCSHNRAWKVFASTVINDHLVGRQCSSSLQINLNTCRGDSLNLGNNDLNKSGSGRYRVNTRWRYPY